MSSTETPKAIDASTKKGEAERTVAATAERKILRAWEAATVKDGPRPATPNLDALNGDAVATLEAHSAKAAKAPQRPEAAGRVQMHYAVNGRPFGSTPGKGQNTMSGLAYFHTKDVVKGKPRISVPELTELLAKAGIAEPRSTTWSHTLPNGVTISGAPVGTAQPAPKKSPARKVAAKKVTTKPRATRQVTPRPKPVRGGRGLSREAVFND